jgi:hypothetical protein
MGKINREGRVQGMREREKEWKKREVWLGKGVG